MAIHLDRSLVLLDDQEFIVCLNSNYPPGDAPGVLLKRTGRSRQAPVCVGSFHRQAADGCWSATINKTSSSPRGGTCVGAYPDRLNAIAALWLNRQLAAIPASS